MIEYADMIKPKSGKVMRTKFNFETERQRGGVTKIKYDVIPEEWIVKQSKFEYENLPPYIYPAFGSEMTWPRPRDLKSLKMLDASFFS